MTSWLKEHRLALIVATLMFALMAAVMAEFLLLDGSFIDSLFGDEGISTTGMLWTWRIGGFLTWPVFIWLLLRPHLNMSIDEHRSCLLWVLVIAALYGGGGLWLISSTWRAVSDLDDTILAFVTPFLAIVTLGLPYLYTWGFVAIYGGARDWLRKSNEHGWVGKSLVATVLGVYGIGALVYLALAMVLIPIGVAASLLPEQVAEHLCLDLCAIALSTGNFMSQWYAFYKVDDYLSDPSKKSGNVPTPAIPTYPSAVPASAAATPGSVPYGTAVYQPSGNVVLPDGRLVTPDGRVYVPQDMPAPGVAGQPAAQAPAYQTGPAVAPQQPYSPQQQAGFQQTGFPPQPGYQQQTGVQQAGAQQQMTYPQGSAQQQAAYQQQSGQQAVSAQAIPQQAAVPQQAGMPQMPTQQLPMPSGAQQGQVPPSPDGGGDDLPFSYRSKNG